MDGKTFSLGHSQYEQPHLWLIGDEWLPETDSRALDYLEDEIDRIKLEPWQRAVRAEMEAYVDRLKWIMERNGRQQ